MGKKDHTTEIKVAKGVEEPTFVVGSFFNGLKVPQSTSFDLYKHKIDHNRLYLHGENETLEYNGEFGDDSSDYVVALYDPSSKSVELYKAPVIPASVTAITDRVHKGPKVKLRGLRTTQQRQALGQAFGTKKAKAAIANLEKNRIDADRLQDMELDIVDAVRAHAAVVPTVTAADDTTSVVRPTPEADVLATQVEDIYPLHNIIPKREWAAIRVASLMEESDNEKRLAEMPWPKLALVSRNLARFVSLGDSRRLAMTYYASLLLGVYHNKFCRDKMKLMEKLENKPAEQLVDGVLQRFAVARASMFGKSKDRAFVIDPFHEDKLVCYLLALLMHIEGFELDVHLLTKELSMKPTRLMGLLHALGATIKPASTTSGDTRGLLRKEALKYKVATLRVPFTLPKMTKRGVRR